MKAIKYTVDLADLTCLADGANVLVYHTNKNKPPIELEMVPPMVPQRNIPVENLSED